MTAKTKKTSNQPADKKKGRDRRGKYQQWLTKDGLTTIEGWARQGLSNEQMAQNMGVATSTLATWKNSYQEISDAIKSGQAPVDFEVENMMLKRAMGYEVKETKTIIEKTPGGEVKQRVETTERHIPPDVTAQIFWLKNRMPDQWRDRKNVDLKSNISVEESNDKFRQYLEEAEETGGGQDEDGAVGKDSQE
jgi:transposase